MRTIIVEDEQLSTAELISSLAAVAPEIEVVAIARTVQQAVQVIEQTAHELIFMDIHLGDGKSFDIFEKIKITAPIIFITAYDQYALMAFKKQGIDYLLKPFSREELSMAINKLGLLSQNPAQEIPPQPTMAETQEYQQRFLVNIGSKMRSVTVNEIAYFMAEGKYLHLYTTDGANYIIDSTITSIIEHLSPRRFFQINRKFIISYNAIKEMIKHTNNRIKVILSPTPPDNESVVSAERVHEFRQWLNR